VVECSTRGWETVYESSLLVVIQDT
jgi:hypothetical protein